MKKLANLPYFGNSPYCYANSVAMLLASLGENVSPSLIEVLSGVGLGACLLKNTPWLFFSWGLPTFGIGHALKILGFQYKLKEVPKTKPALLKDLKKDLAKSPAVIGPLDMGYLIFYPSAASHHGFDHFILAYKMDHQSLYLHDPAGFPHVYLPLNQFKLAWKAEKVAYGRDSYRYWAHPKRVENPTPKKIFQRAIKLFQSIYQESEQFRQKQGRVVGQEAILDTAQRVKNKTASQDEIDQLIYFALPLGARRALDYASFFDPYEPKLADLKRQQAQLFGSGLTLAVQQDWPRFSRTLKKLARIEEEFRQKLMALP